MKRSFSTLLYSNLSKETAEISYKLQKKDMSVIISDNRDYTLTLLVTNKIDLLIVDIEDDLIEYLKKIPISFSTLILTDTQLIKEFNNIYLVDYIQKPILEELFQHKVFLAQKYTEHHKEYLSLYDNMPECCIIFGKKRDGDFYLHDCNQATTKYFRETKEELFGKTTKDLFPTLFDYLDKNLKLSDEEDKVLYFPLTTYENHKIKNWLDCNTYNLPSKKSVLIFSDETTQRKAQEKISHNRTFLQTVIDTSKNLIVFFEKGEVINGNKPFLDFFGCENVEEFLKQHKSMTETFLPAEESGYIDATTNSGNWLEFLDREDRDYKVSITRIRDKKKHTFTPFVNYIESIDYESYVVIFNDITKLEETATTDQLTGCGNRVRFKAILETLISKKQNPLSIILLDIDHFKNINDSFGHDTGDYVLQKLSTKIREFLDKESYFCRWGGEEFVIITTKDLNKTTTLAQEITEYVENINFEKIKKITISSGVTTFKENDSKKIFLKRADNALYSAKSNGRNRVEIN